jgi:polyhydroxyalkanoate synthesis repressor PhaR
LLRARSAGGPRDDVGSLIVRRKLPAKVAHCTKQWPALQKPLILTLGLKPAGAGSGGRDQRMAKSDEPITIKKYANRRLYNTGTSTYVTLEDLASMVKAGEDFVVFDAKTNEDITRSVLTQIIFEQENKEGGQNLLPVNFLRQLIRFYGDSMQMMVPRYLEVSIDSLTKEQTKFREQISTAFGMGGFGAIEEQVRRNMEMFERTFSMFAPFARQGQGAEGAAGTDKDAKPAAAGAAGGGDIDDLKRQIDEMQKRIERIGDKDKQS